jgi:hypothetical protein
MPPFTARSMPSLKAVWRAAADNRSSDLTLRGGAQDGACGDGPAGQVGPRPLRSGSERERPTRRGAHVLLRHLVPATRAADLLLRLHRSPPRDARKAVMTWPPRNRTAWSPRSGPSGPSRAAERSPRGLHWCSIRHVEAGSSVRPAGARPGLGDRCGLMKHLCCRRASACGPFPGRSQVQRLALHATCYEGPLSTP